ncbi:dUTP diphosphatase [Paradesulfitobacterium aromaticivorans]
MDILHSIDVRFKRVREDNEVILPSYATAGSAGVDLHACLERDLEILPGQVVKVPTGWAMELPGSQAVGLVFARSGLAAKFGLALANGVGVIDSDYRGEIQVLVVNQGRESVIIHSGERIAQMLFIPVWHARLSEAASLNDTGRGTGGFGSTGV